MNPNKELWEKGDFTRIAESMRDSGEALVNGARDHERAEGARPRMRRRDDRAAGRAARCHGPRRRHRRATWSRRATAGAAAEGLTNCRFQEGDASDLRALADDSFDLVVSIFGAMFAPQAVRRDEAGLWRKGRSIHAKDGD